jgi:hypothetical protein
MRILTTAGEILAPTTAFATLGACEDSSGMGLRHENVIS